MTTTATTTTATTRSVVATARATRAAKLLLARSAASLASADWAGLAQLSHELAALAQAEVLASREAFLLPPDIVKVVLSHLTTRDALASQVWRVCHSFATGWAWLVLGWTSLSVCARKPSADLVTTTWWRTHFGASNGPVWTSHAVSLMPSAITDRIQSLTVVYEATWETDPQFNATSFPALQHAKLRLLGRLPASSGLHPPLGRPDDVPRAFFTPFLGARRLDLVAEIQDEAAIGIFDLQSGDLPETLLARTFAGGPLHLTSLNTLIFEEGGFPKVRPVGSGWFC